MKKILQLLIPCIILLGFPKTYAQPLNAGFEDWVIDSVTGQAYCENWFALTCSGCIFMFGDHQSTDAYSGSYSSTVHSDLCGFAGIPTAAAIMNGGYSASFANPIFYMPRGEPINYRPAKLTGYYKYVIQSGMDSAMATIAITSNGDTIGYGEALLPPASTFSSFDVNINYTNFTDPPDTVKILLVTNKWDVYPVAALATLNVDDLALPPASVPNSMPIPTSNASWMYVSTEGPGPSTYLYRLHFVGDTVVGGLTYYNLYKDLRSSYTNSSGGQSWYVHPPEYVGAIRNDPAGDKVWYLSPYPNSPESLLYDFTLQAGASLPGHPNLVIESVDSVFIASSYRKRWRSKWTGDPSAMPVDVIEGIGGTAGLVDFGYGTYPVKSLVCFTEDGINLIGDGLACELPQGTALALDPEEIKRNLSVHPNPATDKLHIEWLGRTSNAQVSLMDLAGKRHLFEDVKLAGDSELEIPAQLTPGLYVLQVVIEGESPVAFKLILR